MRVKSGNSFVSFSLLHTHSPTRHTQGQEEVTREQFAELWKEFFSTEDETAAGNFIFGNLKF